MKANSISLNKSAITRIQRSVSFYFVCFGNEDLFQTSIGEKMIPLKPMSSTLNSRKKERFLIVVFEVCAIIVVVVVVVVVVRESDRF
jgi:hypothetical protein